MLALQSANKDDFILDALPYIDDAEYDDTHRKFAMGLIEEEQRQYPKTKDYLKKFPKPRYERFLTDRLKNEFERMSAKKVGRSFKQIFYTLKCFFRKWKRLTCHDMMCRRLQIRHKRAIDTRGQT